MGLCCCVWAFSSCVQSFSSCSKWGPPLSSCALSRFLTVVACCTAWTLGPEGLVASSHVESSWKVKVAQWCLTLCEPMDYTVHGILQARILEWVVFPFFTGSSQPRDRTQVSCIADGFFTSWTTREAQYSDGSFTNWASQEIVYQVDIYQLRISWLWPYGP